MSTSLNPSANRVRLPGPDERPGAAVVIYDGDCRICSNQVERLNRWDGGGRLAYLSLHDPQIAERYPDLSHDDLMAEMHVIDQEGKRHRGAAGFRYLSRRLPKLWWLAPLMHVPGSLPLWQWLYRQMASRRYLFGKTSDCSAGTCQLHNR